MTEHEPSLINLVTPAKKEGVLVHKGEKVVFDDSQYSEDELSRPGSTSHFKKKLSFDSKPVVNLVTPEKRPEKRFFDSESELKEEEVETPEKKLEISFFDSESELEEEEADAMKDIG